MKGKKYFLALLAFIPILLLFPLRTVEEKTFLVIVIPLFFLMLWLFYGKKKR